MRLLTLVSLAKGSKELSYASVAAGLQVEASGARPARCPARCPARLDGLLGTLRVILERILCQQCLHPSAPPKRFLACSERLRRAARRSKRVLVRRRLVLLPVGYIRYTSQRRRREVRIPPNKPVGKLNRQELLAADNVAEHGAQAPRGHHLILAGPRRGLRSRRAPRRRLARPVRARPAAVG